jgi:hypothetical protein
LFVPVRNFDFQRLLNAAQVLVGWTTQAGQPGVVRRRKQVAQNQADNSLKQMPKRVSRHHRCSHKVALRLLYGQPN